MAKQPTTKPGKAPRRLPSGPRGTKPKPKARRDADDPRFDRVEAQLRMIVADVLDSTIELGQLREVLNDLIAWMAQSAASPITRADATELLRRLEVPEDKPAAAPELPLFRSMRRRRRRRRRRSSTRS
jgi:hypothetical protein